MNETRMVELKLPEGVAWPEGVPLPQIEVMQVSMRKTIIGEDGKMTEVTKVFDVPVINKSEEEE